LCSNEEKPIRDTEMTENAEAVDIRIIAPTEVIDTIVIALGESGHPVTPREVLDSSYLGLDFSTVADVATVLNVTLVSDPLVPVLARWFRPRAQARRIVIETPLGRVTLDTRDELTEEEIRERLAKAVGLL
jgi:hypothetical protein